MPPECKINKVGIRPGEKLHESLISTDEARQAVEVDDMYIIKPTYPWWGENGWKNGKPLPEGFSYTSNNNDSWISPERLLKMIDNNRPDIISIPKQSINPISQPLRKQAAE